MVKPPGIGELNFNSLFCALATERGEKCGLEFAFGIER
jgi:hypothetical protein